MDDLDPAGRRAAPDPCVQDAPACDGQTADRTVAVDRERLADVLGDALIVDLELPLDDAPHAC